MTTLIIEDGSKVANSNSFITVANAGSYLAGRSATWTSAATTAQENALFTAGQYLNSLNWKGQKRYGNQSMSWPRVSVYTRDNYLVNAGSIPVNVPYAQVEAAVADLDGYDLFTIVKSTDRLKRKKIDVLEKEFFASAYSGRTDFHLVNSLLVDYLTSAGIVRRA